MKQPQSPAVSRIGYYHGQQLAARDLQDEADFESRMRGLHMRGLHNTWGVALGFEVVRQDALVLQVGPGLAYDAHGREIVSAHTLNVGPPVLPRNTGAGAWWFDLVIRYDDWMEPPLASLGCFQGVPPGEERPRWRWCYAGPAAGAKAVQPLSPEVRLGEDIPLVRVRLTDEPGFDEALDFSLRRAAQGLVRPHVAGGSPQRNLALDTSRFAFTTTIDTSAAGFNQTPFYFARVSIPALLQLAQSGESLPSFLGPFVTVRSPQRTSFSLDVRIAQTSSVLRAAATTVPTVPAQVTWIGVEPTGGCPPSLTLFAAFFLFQPIEFFPVPGVAAGFGG